MCKRLYSKERDRLLILYHKQVKQVPYESVKIPCQGAHPGRDNNVECNKEVSIMYAYKCLYCKFWFCQSCAEEHFGQTIEEYYKENGDA